MGVLGHPSKALDTMNCLIYDVKFLASRDECHSPGVGVRVSVCAWTKTLYLAITFLPEVLGLSYCTCVFLVTRPFTWFHNF